jgi:hypothetical protein
MRKCEAPSTATFSGVRPIAPPLWPASFAESAYLNVSGSILFEGELRIFWSRFVRGTDTAQRQHTATPGAEPFSGRRAIAQQITGRFPIATTVP